MITAIFVIVEVFILLRNSFYYYCYYNKEYMSKFQKKLLSLKMGKECVR